MFGSQAKETDIPSDVWRFYLIYVRPEVQDTEFQVNNFIKYLNLSHWSSMYLIEREINSNFSGAIFKRKIILNFWTTLEISSIAVSRLFKNFTTQKCRSPKLMVPWGLGARKWMIFWKSILNVWRKTIREKD